MAATDKLLLKADPDSVVVDGKSTLTATLTDKDNVPLEGKEITFIGKVADMPEFEIDKKKTEKSGIAELTFELKNIPKNMPKNIPPSAVSVTATAADGVQSQEVEIKIFGTQQEADLDQNLKGLSEAKREQQEIIKKIETLQQTIDLFIKTPPRPNEIDDAKKNYSAVVDAIKIDVDKAENDLKQIEDMISAQIDKVKRDAIVAQITKFDGEIKAHQTELVKLEKDLADAEAKVNEAQKQQNERKGKWESTKKTEPTIRDAVKDLTAKIGAISGVVKTGVANNDKAKIANVYPTLLNVKEQLVATKRMVIEPTALEKNLLDAWQQMNAQSLPITILEDQKQSKEDDFEKAQTELQTLIAERDKKLKTAINKIVAP